jgi:hypothetical protein
MKFRSDIDIDFGDRTKVLAILKHIPASIKQEDKLVKHNSGVYFTDIPVDPFAGVASIEHKSAEERGYVKLDLLNVNLYSQVRDEAHLNELMSTDPLWDLLLQREFTEQLSHIGNHHGTLVKMPEPVNSIPRMAMFLAIIRPGKRHLIGKPWAEVAESIWDTTEDGYTFKRSHAVAYAHLVVVHMNLICEQVSYGFS